MLAHHSHHRIGRMYLQITRPLNKTHRTDWTAITCEIARKGWPQIGLIFSQVARKSLLQRSALLSARRANNERDRAESSGIKCVRFFF